MGSCLVRSLPAVVIGRGIHSSRRRCPFGLLSIIALLITIIVVFVERLRSRRWNELFTGERSAQDYRSNLLPFLPTVDFLSGKIRSCGWGSEQTGGWNDSRRDIAIGSLITTTITEGESELLEELIVLLTGFALLLLLLFMVKCVVVIGKKK